MKILVIEDDATLRRTVIRCLDRWLDRPEVKIAESADEAIDHLKDSALTGQFSLVVSDYNLLGTRTGADVLAWIRDHMPHLEKQFLFLSGNPDAAKHGVPSLEKACEMTTFHQTITSMVNL